MYTSLAELIVFFALDIYLLSARKRTPQGPPLGLEVVAVVTAFSSW